MINYTLTKRHSGDEEVLQLYRGLLTDKNPKNHRFIWIVEDPNNFKKQDKFNDIKQYCMSYADVKADLKDEEIVDINEDEELC